MVALLTDQRIVFLNALANQPGIIAALAPGYQNIDLSEFFKREGSIMLGDEHGAALFTLLEPGVFEGHYLLPSRTYSDQHPIIDVCRGFLREMFTERGAQTIVGYTPVENYPARAMSRALGFTPQGSSVSQSGRSCVKYVLERRAWATLSAGL